MSELELKFENHIKALEEFFDMCKKEKLDIKSSYIDLLMTHNLKNDRGDSEHYLANIAYLAGSQRHIEKLRALAGDFGWFLRRVEWLPNFTAKYHLRIDYWKERLSQYFEEMDYLPQPNTISNQGLLQLATKFEVDGWFGLPVTIELQRDGLTDNYWVVIISQNQRLGKDYTLYNLLETNETIKFASVELALSFYEEYKSKSCD